MYTIHSKHRRSWGKGYATIGRMLPNLPQCHNAIMHQKRKVAALVERPTCADMASQIFGMNFELFFGYFDNKTAIVFYTLCTFEFYV